MRPFGLLLTAAALLVSACADTPDQDLASLRRGQGGGAGSAGQAAVGGAASSQAGAAGQAPSRSITVTPPTASMFGQVDVVLEADIAPLGADLSVTVGGVKALHVRPGDGQRLTVMLQGAPSPGPAEIVIAGAGRSITEATAFSYEPPRGGVKPTFLAFGASVTSGAISFGLDQDSQRMGPVAQVARAAGVFLALPLLVDGLAPPLTPADFGDDCLQKPGTGVDVGELIKKISDPDTGKFDIRLGRLDPTLVSRDIAVPGAKVHEVLLGLKSGTAFTLEHLLYPQGLPPDGLFKPIPLSQIERIEQLDPDVGISTDLLGNDLDVAVVDPDDVRVDKITPLEKVEPLLQQMAGRLGKLSGHYFLCNMPSMTFAPGLARLRQRRLAEGSDTEASFDAKVAKIEAMTDAYNVAFESAFAPYPNVHIVDMHAEAEKLRAGKTVGAERLTLEHFGGLISLDDLHFTYTGNALVAEMLVNAINATLGTSIPAIDVQAVHRDDPLSPKRLRGEGLGACVPGE